MWFNTAILPLPDRIKQRGVGRKAGSRPLPFGKLMVMMTNFEGANFGEDI
jgi:hypothetical protein